MKVPEAVRQRFRDALPSISVPSETAWAIDAALDAALEQLREELTADAALCAFEMHGHSLSMSPPGAVELEDLRRRMNASWESVLGDKGQS